MPCCAPRCRLLVRRFQRDTLPRALPEAKPAPCVAGGAGGGVLPGCGECRQDEFGMPYRLARCARKHEYESERRFEAFGLAAFARQGASKDGFGQEPKR